MPTEFGIVIGCLQPSHHTDALKGQAARLLGQPFERFIWLSSVSGNTSGELPNALELISRKGGTLRYLIMSEHQQPACGGHLTGLRQELGRDRANALIQNQKHLRGYPFNPQVYFAQNNDTHIWDVVPVDEEGNPLSAALTEGPSRAVQGLRVMMGAAVLFGVTRLAFSTK